MEWSVQQLSRRPFPHAATPCSKSQRLVRIKFPANHAYVRENLREKETKLKDYKTSLLFLYRKEFFHALIHSDPTTTAWSNPGLSLSNTSAASSNGARETFHLCW